MPEAPLPLRGMLGRAILRPAFDWLALRAIAQVYLRVSRGWAAALDCDDDLERFLVDSGLAAAGVAEAGHSLRRAIDRAQARQAAYRRARAAWEAGFFGPEARDGMALAALERKRCGAAHELMAARSGFLPQRSRLAPVAWEIATPEEVEARHGPRLADPTQAFPLPDMPEIATSQSMSAPGGPERWLRFRSPDLGDEAWAHVFEPNGDGPRDGPAPTALFLHGVGMEIEMWRGHTGVVPALTARGFRVISAEGPWHGRRRSAGRYGGEPVFSLGPQGLLDLLQAWTAEVSVLIRWARASGGPVVLTGVSLGALAAQRAASAALGWPQDVRPDALMLVATSGSLFALAGAGSLARQIGVDRKLHEAGWDEAALRRWLPLAEPGPQAPLPPERIVMALGREDDLLPYPGGRALAESWGLPAENLFERPQGHFSVALGVLNETEPLDRLTALTARL